MKKVHRIPMVNYIMLAVNWITVLVLCGFICITTKNICDNYIARDFIGKLGALPWKPEQILLEAGILLLCLTISFLIREMYLSENSPGEAILLVLEFAIAFLLVMLLNFNYNGILLWVFANVISRTKKNRGQFLLVFLAVLSFVGTDYGLMSIQFHLYNIQDYIDYYDAGTQSYLMGGYNLLVSVNMVFFIIFCIFVIEKQRGTIQEVNLLYEQLSKANADLQEANVELQKYAMMKEKMGETKERNRLAREIHDTLGHTLTGISAGLDACVAMLEVAPDRTRQQLEILSNVTREGIQEVRRSVSELRPDALERFSLERAIQKMIQDTNSVTNTRITFECSLEHLKFDEDEENAIYRVIQESVTNAIRHGHATEISISMKLEEGVIHIRVKDNGTGCEKITPGFGTEHMKERIHMLKGEVTFDGSDGFTVDVMIPIRWGEEYD